MLHRQIDSGDRTSTNVVTDDNNSDNKFSVIKDSTSMAVPSSTDTHLVSHASKSSPRSSRIILATATVLVHADNGRAVKVRALIDPASTWTMATEDLINSLNARKFKTSTAVSGVGGLSAGTVGYSASIAISPTSSNAPLLHTHAVVLHTLTRYIPQAETSLINWPHLEKLSLADEDPLNSEPIRLLIGADLYGLVILEGLVKGAPDQPIAQNTIFGWILTGWTLPPVDSAPPITRTYVPLLTKTDFDLESRLDELLTRFWKVDDLAQHEAMSPEDAQCEAHFNENVSRRSDGRYIVRLPLRVSPAPIGRTYNIALRCFLSLEKKLIKTCSDYTAYREFMEDYLRQGHMSPAPTVTPVNSPIVYLPHHAVKKESSTTTKLRVVFNASSSSDNNSSLNDHVFSGPKLQSDLFLVLLNWRRHRFVLSADITQMYRQILIAPADRDYQRILWRSNPLDPIGEYQLNTVTFGVSCAPFLALRVLQQLNRDDGARFPLGSDVLNNGLYVDDCLFGADSLEEAALAQKQLIQLLSGGGFHLRKWASNSPELLADIDPSNHGLAFEKPFLIDDSIKLLGVFWNPTLDSFQFQVNTTEIPVPTKRLILSTVARLIDPMGWAAPTVIVAKIMLQSLWRQKLDWDTPIPTDMLAQWTKWYNTLPHLDQIRLPRWVQLGSDAANWELHGFCDASIHAYAAVIYLWVQSESNHVSTHLLISRTKVAPTKTPKSFDSPELTIPRLELCGALLLSHLFHYILQLTVFHCVPYVCWTDATIVLNWLNNPPSQSQPFVTNRVKTILNNTHLDQWRHVPTGSNPVDLASRGMTADRLALSHLWFDGPTWLRDPPDNWPKSPLDTISHSCHVYNVDLFEQLSSRISKWNRLLVVTSCLLRWLPQHRLRRGCPPDASELQRAATLWYKWLQKQLFAKELSCLLKSQLIDKSSPLASLNPFLDNDSLIRVGGRLANTKLDWSAQHPIILSSHPVVRLMVEQAHQRCLHGQLSLVLATLRSTIWIIRAKPIIRSVIFRCITCTRLKAETASQLMGSLPAARVTESSRPFTHTGVDYAGPIQVRIHQGRGYRSHSAYIALFVCFTSKAIHLELVSDYSSPTFIAAFRRFSSRRGLPTHMYSDRGTTFTGADIQLQAAFRAATSNPHLAALLARDRVTWHFLPPAAPHFGGLWEAGVKSVKFHLKTVLRDRTPTFEELTTLLCEIEACLNSRPLAPLNDSADDLEVLTPGHFLVGSPLTAPPTPSVLDFSVSSLSRWQAKPQLLESFWRQWSADYILSLQHRSKWRRPQENLQPGQIVLIRLPNLPPTKWPLARIVKCFPGDDGLVRTVKVITAPSSYLRPIDQLALLPIADFITPHLS